MKLSFALAAIAATLLAAGAPAQPAPAAKAPPRQTTAPAGSEAGNTTTQSSALTDDNLLWDDKPTRDSSLDIGLVAREPVEVLTAKAKVSGLVNGEELTFSDSIATLQPDCGGPVSFPIRVEDKKPCRIEVTLNDPGTPGLYTAKVFLFPRVGDRKQVTLKFAVRRSVCIAIGLVLAGLAAGFVITAWRGSGRERSEAVIAIKESAEALEFLDSGTGQPRMTPVLDRARTMVESLIRGASVDAAEIAALQARVGQYRFLQQIEARGSGLPADKKSQLAAAIVPVIDAMMPGPSGKLGGVPDATFIAVRDKLHQLETEVAAVQGASDSALPLETMPLPVTAGMTSAEARRAFDVMEWAVALILMLIFTAAALGTLYYGKTFWGSYGDMVAAFMIGFGAYAGSVASVDTFIQRARTAPA